MSLLVTVGLGWVVGSGVLLVLVAGLCRSGHDEDVARGYVDRLG